MLTIQQMMRAVRDLQARVAVLEANAAPKPVEIPVELEPVVRRGRPRKVDVEGPPEPAKEL